MERIKNKIDKPWDKNGTLREYILESYYGGKRLRSILRKVQKRYPNDFKNEAELTKWIEENSPESGLLDLEGNYSPNSHNSH